MGSSLCVGCICDTLTALSQWSLITMNEVLRWSLLAVFITQTLCNQDWEVSVFTSNKDYAGTSANVYMVIHGDHGDTGHIALNPAKGYYSGTEEKFTRSVEDVGTPLSITIWEDGTGSYAGWHLQEVELRGYRTERWYSYCFYFNKWLDTNERVTARAVDCSKNTIVGKK